uniref:Uncharacterized protein n=1 Tax=Glossina pallidipes TaxID=7398 RepID=A0A1A9Z2G0_GLOPL
MHMMLQIMQQLANLQRNLIICTDTQAPYPEPLLISRNMGDHFNLFKPNWIAYSEATGIATWSVKRESKNVNMLWSLADGEARLEFDNYGVQDKDKLHRRYKSIDPDKIEIKMLPDLEIGQGVAIQLRPYKIKISDRTYAADMDMDEIE